MTLTLSAWPSPARYLFVPGLVLIALAAGVVVGLDPGRGVILLAVGALIGASALVPEIATFAFVLAIYSNAPVIVANSYGVPEYLAAASIGMLGFPLVRQITRREPFVVTSALLPMIVYVGVVFLSASAAGFDAGERVGIVLTEGLLLFLLMSNAVRSLESLRRVIWALLIAGALMSIVTIHQAVTGNYDSNYGGFATVERGFEVDVAGQAFRQERAAGPVGEKNRFAQVLLVLVPLGIGRIKDAKGLRRRLLAAGATGSILIAIVLTYSRGGAIAVAAIVLAAVLLHFVRWRTLLAVALITVAASILLAPTFVGRVLSIGNAAELFSDSGDEAEGAIVGRATSNLAAFNVLLDHPIIGVGPGLYGPYYSVEYANRLGLRHFDEPRRAHNLFLEVGAETGVLGLAVFIAILFAITVPLWRLRREWATLNQEHANLATALLLALIGYVTAGLFLHLAYERYLWIIVALAASAAWILTPHPLRWYEGRLKLTPAMETAR